MGGGQEGVWSEENGARDLVISELMRILSVLKRILF